MDNIYRKMGKASIKLASEGFTRPWKMKQGNKSPANTTKWNAITWDTFKKIPGNSYESLCVDGRVERGNVKQLRDVLAQNILKNPEK